MSVGSGADGRSIIASVNFITHASIYLELPNTKIYCNMITLTLLSSGDHTTAIAAGATVPNKL